MSYLDSMILHLDMSTINPTNICPRTYGSLNGTGTGLVASTDIVPGIGGGMATELNGTDEKINFGSNVSSFKFASGSFAISGMVKMAQQQTNAPNLFGAAASGTTDRYGFICGDDSNDRFRPFITDNAGTYAAVTGGTIVYDVWYHVVMSVDRTADLLYLFRDGELDGTPASLSAVTTIDPAGSVDCGIATTGAGAWLDGVVDSLMVFDDSLTQLQAADLNQRIRQGRL